MPLVHYNCSKHLRLFLCAVFAPVCSEHVAMQIPACKSLCLSVRRECEPALTSLTLPWPHMLDCDRFLDRGDEKVNFLLGPLIWVLRIDSKNSFSLVDLFQAIHFAFNHPRKLSRMPYRQFNNNGQRKNKFSPFKRPRDCRIIISVRLISYKGRTYKL